MFSDFARGFRPLSAMGRSATAWEPPGSAPTLEADPVQYFSGLDLGQPSEFTALAVLERTAQPDPENLGRKLRFYAVRHLERFELGTSFPDICARLKAVFSDSRLQNSTLTVDQTAVGHPVIDLLRRGRLGVSTRPLTITAGQRSEYDPYGTCLVPKIELVSTLQVLLQSRRMKVAPSLPQAKTLTKELSRYRAKSTLASVDTLEDWREGPHDDLVLAVAIAAWQSEHLREFWMR
jgi:hypothetical protein